MESFWERTGGHGFLVRDPFFDGLFFAVCPTVSKLLSHLDTVVPGHLWTFQRKHKQVLLEFLTSDPITEIQNNQQEGDFYYQTRLTH